MQAVGTTLLKNTTEGFGQSFLKSNVLLVKIKMNKERGGDVPRNY